MAGQFALGVGLMVTAVAVGWWARPVDGMRSPRIPNSTTEMLVTTVMCLSAFAGVALAIAALFG